MVEELATAILTLTHGLYGYGWVLEWRKSNSSGRSYQAVVHIDPADGKSRYEAGESPSVPDDEAADLFNGAGDVQSGPDDPE